VKKKIEVRPAYTPAYLQFFPTLLVLSLLLLLLLLLLFPLLFPFLLLLLLLVSLLLLVLFLPFLFLLLLWFVASSRFGGRTVSVFGSADGPRDDAKEGALKIGRDGGKEGRRSLESIVVDSSVSDHLYMVALRQSVFLPHPPPLPPSLLPFLPPSLPSSL